jgi:hypothetical protein
VLFRRLASHRHHHHVKRGTLADCPNTEPAGWLLARPAAKGLRHSSVCFSSSSRRVGVERAFGKPREHDPAKDGEEPLRYLELRAARQSSPLTLREIAAIEELASARLAAIEARASPRESGADSDGPV